EPAQLASRGVPFRRGGSPSSLPLRRRGQWHEELAGWDSFWLVRRRLCECCKIALRLPRKPPFAAKIRLVAGRSGMIGGKESGMAEAIVHGLEIGCARHDVRARIEGIGA